MEQSYIYDTPFVDSVFHPSDFSVASENAFAHALAISLIRQTKLTILHAGGSEDAWQNFPAVRGTLERWGVLEPGSPRSAVFEDLALRVKKVAVRGRDPVKATLHYLEQHPTDLIVLATEGREGLQRWLQPSVAERIALKSRTNTLFVPNSARGFVSVQTGEITLQRILVPVDYHPSPLPAIEYAVRAAQVTGKPTEIVLFHVGDTARMPALNVPKVPNVKWKTRTAEGDVVEAIARATEEAAADLVIMTTAGHEGFLDALRGSVTQQVVRRTPCPLLAVQTA